MKPFTIAEQLRLYAAYAFEYPAMVKFTTLPPEQVSEYQFSRVKTLISLAYHRTDFYYRLYSKLDIHPDDVKSWQDFARLPTITKADVRRNFRSCIVDGNPGRSPRISKSSGSSGEVLELVGDTRHWIKSTLVMIRTFQESFEYRPFAQRNGVTIYTSPFPSQSRLGVFSARYLSTLTPSPELIKAILRERPPFVISYPSILLELATEFPEQCGTLKLIGISTNSEQSSQKQRDVIGAVFGCPVFDEYSTEELREVGFQCGEKSYHLQEDLSVIEILDPDSDISRNDGETGEIVGTSLSNTLMPFIRYRQGDLGSLRPSACSCGKTGRILSNISGRKNSSFMLENGENIPSGRILDWTYKLVLQLGIPIRQFQITQLTRATAEILIVPENGYQPGVHDRSIQQSFRAEFGSSLHLSVKVVNRIARSEAGKHIPIRSLIT